VGATGTLDIVNSTGTLEVLRCASCSRNRGGYDMMFGYTGLMSLGPVLYFAVGTYVFDIALTIGRGARPVAAVDVWRLSGTRGRARRDCPASARIAFAMVTLAFAQAFYFLVESNPHNLTGGDTGLSLTYTRLPSFLSGPCRTRETSTGSPSRSSSWRT